MVVERGNNNTHGKVLGIRNVTIREGERSNIDV